MRPKAPRCAHPASFFRAECARIANKRRDIAHMYAWLLLFSQYADFDWPKIHNAVLSRWSNSGLHFIKRQAWKLLNL